MSERKRTNAVHVDIPELNSWRLKLGFSKNQLAKMCDVDVRTIERVYERGTASPFTYSQLLEVMQREAIDKGRRIGLPDELIDFPKSIELSGESAENTNEVRRDDYGSDVVTVGVGLQGIEITIRGDIESFSKEKREQVMNAIRGRLEGKEVDIHQYRKGSIKMTLAISPEDAERLLWAIKAGDLDEIGIADAELCDLVHSDSPVNNSNDASVRSLEVRSIELNAHHEALIAKWTKIALRYLAPLAETAGSTAGGAQKASFYVPSFFSDKIIYERLLGGVLSVAAFPALFVFWLMVKLTSTGPGIIRQTRVGKGGELFDIFKIRTFYNNLDGTQEGRCTPIGRMLRFYSFDELPQLWNLFRGEMGLIGPYPERPEVISEHRLNETVPGFTERTKVLPGITGLAQVNLPPDQSVESICAKVVLDLEYIGTASMWLDFRIFLCAGLKTLGFQYRFSTKLLGLSRRIDVMDDSC